MRQHEQIGDNIIFKGIDFSFYDATGIELKNVIFKYCNFTRASFLACKMTNVQFINCSMFKVNFNKATLINVSFWRSYVAYATFDETTLIDAHGHLVDFTGVDFLTATVENAFMWIGNFKDAKANPDAGFRTKKGGDGIRYKIPVVCEIPEACEKCFQSCKGEKNENSRKLL